MPLPLTQQSKEDQLAELRKYFHLSVKEAANQLNVCTTIIKTVCRNNNIKRWPARKIRSVLLHIDQINKCLEVDSLTPDQKKRLENYKEILETKHQELYADPNQGNITKQAKEAISKLVKAILPNLNKDPGSNSVLPDNPSGVNLLNMTLEQKEGLDSELSKQQESAEDIQKPEANTLSQNRPRKVIPLPDAPDPKIPAKSVGTTLNFFVKPKQQTNPTKATTAEFSHSKGMPQLADMLANQAPSVTSHRKKLNKKASISQNLHRPYPDLKPSEHRKVPPSPRLFGDTQKNSVMSSTLLSTSECKPVGSMPQLSNHLK